MRRPDRSGAATDKLSLVASWEGRSGDLLVVPQERHSLEALDDAAVLLTVVKHG